MFVYENNSEENSRMSHTSLGQNHLSAGLLPKTKNNLLAEVE